MTETIPVVPVRSGAPDLLAELAAGRARGAAPLPLPADAEDPHLEAPAGTALVVRTSGTSGRPRHVALPEGALAAAVDASLRRLDCVAGERWALALPIHHVAGILVLLRATALGTTAVPVGRPGEPDALGGLDVEHIAVVPTQLVRALRSGVDLTRFRTVLVGGGPLDPATRELAAVRGVRIVESYGATESCGGCVYDGIPLDGVAVRLDKDGEIWISGAMLASEYLDDASATNGRFVDGWFRTGDAGRLDAGVLRVMGRRDDVAVSGGVNVPLAAVGAALRSAHGVMDAVAVAVQDPEWGAIVRAVVVAGDGREPRLAELRDHVASRLPRTHAPRELLRVTAIDRDPLGKLAATVRAALAGAEPTERLE